MIKIYCDRCGKDITNKPKYKFTIQWEGLKGNGRCYSIPKDADQQFEKDICMDCYNEFIEFMKEME